MSCGRLEHVTLLDEVIDGASGTAPVAQLLRQVKVLASRTGTPQLETWVDHELVGYPDDVDVPTYRGPFVVRPLGHFVGPYGMEARNVEIPPSTFPAKYRNGLLFKRIFDEPIATIEQMAVQEFTNFGWPPDSVRLYQFLVQKGEISRVVNDALVLAEVRYTVPAATFVAISDAVRTKILDLALELERVAPMAGQRDVPPDQEAPAAAVINNHFHGASNVAIAAVGTSQVVVEAPSAGDGDALVRYLGAAGVSADQLVELERALDDDSDDPEHYEAGNGTLWPRTRAWLGKAATDTTTGALGGAIASAAAGFLG